MATNYTPTASDRLTALQDRNAAIRRNIENAYITPAATHIIAPARDLGDSPTSPIYAIRVDLTPPGGIRHERRLKYHALYETWRRRNVALTADEINTQYNYFKRQSKRSIEVFLLEAISKWTEFKTKTTSFTPLLDYGIVKLFGEQIVKIEKASFGITEVSFPEGLLTHINGENLLRLRLRQLGTRCVSVKGNNRLYLSGDKYVFLKSGGNVPISDTYKKPCLPKTWYDRVNVIVAPQQLGLDFKNTPTKDFYSDVTELKQYRFVESGWAGEIHLDLIEDYYVLRGRAIPTADMRFISGPYHKEIRLTMESVEGAGLIALVEHFIEEFKAELMSIRRNPFNTDYTATTTTTTTIPNWTNITFNTTTNNNYQYNR